MDVRTVKILDDGVEVLGKRTNGSTAEPAGTKFPESPTKAMLDALEELQADVPKIVGLGKKGVVDLVRLYGATAQVSPAGELRSVTFYFKLRTAQGDVAFTGKPLFVQVSDEVSASVLPDTTLKRLTKFFDAADRYYSGPREQGSFWDESGSEPAAAAGGKK